MIIEERIYTLKIGKVAEYLKLYEQEGMAIQRPHLGGFLGYYFTETGTINTLVHLWAYEDVADRAQRRAKLQADPRWKEFLPKIVPLMERQENRILIPAPFWETSLRAMLAAVSK